MKLVDYGHEDVRRAAVSSLGQFTICIGKHPNGELGEIEIRMIAFLHKNKSKNIRIISSL